MKISLHLDFLVFCIFISTSFVVNTFFQMNQTNQMKKCIDKFMLKIYNLNIFSLYFKFFDFFFFIFMKEMYFIDLFSGLGGFSLALKPALKTIAYCEIDQICKNILQKHMKNRDIHNAPIFDDINKFTYNVFQTRNTKEIRETNKISKKSKINKIENKENKEPSVLTAGFPCQDISVANIKGKGIHGLKSGLFKQILRIIDEFPQMNACFFENSFMIIKRGFSYVEQELKRRGFHIKWCFIQGLDVGAYHRRKRWYCLCCRHNIEQELDYIPIENILYPWDSIKNKKRIVRVDHLAHRSGKHSEDYNDKYMTRCQLLGNSIIPQCASYAWNTLLHAYKMKNTRTQIILQRKDEEKEKEDFPESFKIPQSFDIDLKLTFSDYDKVHFCKKRWATPTYYAWYIFSNIQNSRSKTILPLQMYYEINTHIEENDKQKKRYAGNYLSNPEFVENLMGYPSQWTSLT